MSMSFIPAGNQGTPNEFEAINAVQFLQMRPEKIQIL